MNLEERINQWAQLLHMHDHLEDGIIAELEDHLRDEIENLVDQGYSKSEAFEIAVEQLGSMTAVDEEEKTSVKCSL